MRNKIKKTNFDNDNQVKSLLEYADESFTNLEMQLKSKRYPLHKTRKKNKGRLGNNPDVAKIVSPILSTPISEIKPEDLNAYNEFLKISKRERLQESIKIFNKKPRPC